MKLINKYKNIKFIYCNLEKETEIIKMAKKAAKFFNGPDVKYEAAATQSLVSVKKITFQHLKNIH